MWKEGSAQKLLCQSGLSVNNGLHLSLHNSDSLCAFQECALCVQVGHGQLNLPQGNSSVSWCLGMRVVYLSSLMSMDMSAFPEKDGACGKCGRGSQNMAINSCTSSPLLECSQPSLFQYYSHLFEHLIFFQSLQCMPTNKILCTVSLRWCHDFYWILI